MNLFLLVCTLLIYYVQNFERYWNDGESFLIFSGNKFHSSNYFLLAFKKSFMDEIVLHTLVIQTIFMNYIMKIDYTINYSHELAFSRDLLMF